MIAITCNLVTEQLGRRIQMWIDHHALFKPITKASFRLEKGKIVETINEAFRTASNDKSYRGVLEYSDEPLVSADIVGNPSSCIYSSLDTMANGRMVKVLGWYDNEWGYSNRLVDLVEFVGSK